MGDIERFATAGIQPAEQLPFWNRLAEETFSGLTVDCPSNIFRAEMWRWSFGGLTMIRPRSPAAVVQHRPDLHRTRADLVTLHLQNRGRCLHTQAGRSGELQSGDFAICASDADYRLDLSERNDMLVVEMPRSALAARVPDLDSKVARHIPGGGTGGRLLRDFVLSLWQQGDQSEADPLWQEGVANVLLDLLALALRGPVGTEPAARRPDERLAALVDAHLWDPDLRTATLAEALNLSNRSIQHMFAAMGTTPSGYILERRLERAAERLVEAPSVSITTVAFDLGFNDSAYFARCFRRRFGTTPSLFRGRH
ncbi:MAG: helix-turn-helix protein [Sphingomonas bacterium]|jgi:AraC-like DNA-binding protein|nr:helix-turn-helix protein [Sphingomonas bacterium]MDB5716892.1 helix-turn-helix protein [Sphingomonas bacterium]